LVFNSYTFILFLAVVLAFYSSPIRWKSKKILLIGASYLFYAAWNPPFVILIWFSTLVDWLLAQRIAYATSIRLRKFFLICSLSVNLGLLGFFKYSEFLVNSFVDMAAMIGVAYQPLEMDIILPVGISFYTFQTLSYTLDIYKRQMKPWHSFTDYALYVTFFPQLVAGPIVRAHDFLPQCDTPKSVNWSKMGWAVSLIILGIFQKVVLADGLFAPVVEKVYDSTAIVSSMAAAVGTLAFAGQIFCDFAGYSTTAIGVAMALGFALPDNFRFPYAAIGFSDFWRRWHISLSSWLRDYLYISMGGSRHGKVKTYRNLALTMLIGGLWHGASWTFVVWGGLHGSYLVLERLANRLMGQWRIWKTMLGRLFLAGVTFGLVCLAWVFFRASSFDKAFEIIQATLFLLPYAEIYVSRVDVALVGVGITGLLFMHAMLRNTTLEDAAAKVPDLLKAMVLGIMLTLIIMSPGEDRAFIYFQF
tara:strand:+ start:5810 stop:7231 length:1422 start_codon:yes stop_codon:yes gene_type:complete